MRKSRSLSDLEIELINDNYDKICNILRKKFGHHRLIYMSRAHSYTELMSYLPEIAMEYSQKKWGKSNFVKYAVYRSYLRFIDNCRSIYRKERPKIRYKSAIEKMKEKLVKDKGYMSQHDLDEEIGKAGIKRSNTNFTVQSLDSVDAAYVDHHGGFEEVDWQDTKDAIDEKIDRHFRGSNLEIYRTLIKEYLIPKCDGEDHPCLREIGERFEKTEGRMSQMLRDDLMQRFAHNLCLSK